MNPKVLVANRSEIACRVFQTCREMGLTSVGIVAPGDEEARHITYADEVKSVASYLDIASVIKAAKESGASFIHPGYGFLSERPAFAQAVVDAGLTFIGPKAETMALMGDKIAAKELASKEKVPTLPWAKVSSNASVVAAAKEVGYPLLLKAAAGGGGKGMRRVNRAEDLLGAAESASAEALAAFGDGTLFLEHLVEAPRHIEVQVFGDGQGGGVHLFERECSLQRRHQKVWEEAPATHLKEATRQAIYDAALRLVRATQYRSAGTIEFLVESPGNTTDSSGAEEKFYFLEMNTRLQVEHPVTELITGVDLVWAQIAFAQNPKKFPLVSPLQKRGHAIEVRLYAEDAAQGFIPTPGRVEKLRWPTGAGIRIESGIEEGQTIGIQFDSMLGKLIVYGENRPQALARLQFALEETVILGMGTNQNYLRTILDHPKVREGVVHTGFLEAELGAYAPVPSELELELLALAKTQGLGKSLGNFGNQDSNSSQQHPSPWFAGVGKANSL
ncbi:MAG: biotin carboxylase N-terminal domain-containing protein [Bdellovibrionia bacterium]